MDKERWKSEIEKDINLGEVNNINDLNESLKKDEDLTKQLKSEFANKLLNGLGEKIKNSERSYVPIEKKNKFRNLINAIKDIFKND